MEEITYVDFMDRKRVCKDFKIKKFGEYHDLYLTSDTLLLADVFENFRNVYKNLWIRSCKISFTSRISMACNFKKDQSKIRSFSW